MSQNFASQTAQQVVSGATGFVATDAQNAVITGKGVYTSLGVSASTVIYAGAGRVAKVIVTTAGAAGTINDCATTGAAAAGNLIATVPATVGIYDIDFPFSTGLVYVPGSGQVVSISYNK